MRAVVQRVSSASVSVEGRLVSSIGAGLLVLLGIHKDDCERDSGWLIKKILNLRIFEDDAGKMGRSVLDISGAILVVSQFTLYGDAKKGNRPDFTASMPGPQAREFYAAWMTKLRAACNLEIKEGVFAAMMSVQLVNEGPVTIVIDSKA